MFCRNLFPRKVLIIHTLRTNIAPGTVHIVLVASDSKVNSNDNNRYQHTLS